MASRLDPRRWSLARQLLALQVAVVAVVTARRVRGGILRGARGHRDSRRGADAGRRGSRGRDSRPCGPPCSRMIRLPFCSRSRRRPAPDRNRLRGHHVARRRPVDPPEPRRDRRAVPRNHRTGGRRASRSPRPSPALWARPFGRWFRCGPPTGSIDAPGLGRHHHRGDDRHDSRRQVPVIVGAGLIALALAGLGSWLVSRRLRRQTHDLARPSFVACTTTTTPCCTQSAKGSSSSTDARVCSSPTTRPSGCSGWPPTSRSAHRSTSSGSRSAIGRALADGRDRTDEIHLPTTGSWS